jgi:hypothetical protein
VEQDSDSSGGTEMGFVPVAPEIAGFEGNNLEGIADGATRGFPVRQQNHPYRAVIPVA